MINKINVSTEKKYSQKRTHHRLSRKKLKEKFSFPDHSQIPLAISSEKLFQIKLSLSRVEQQKMIISTFITFQHKKEAYWPGDSLEYKGLTNILKIF